MDKKLSEMSNEELWKLFPIVDILVELEPTADLNGVKELLFKKGYRIMSEEPHRASFNKGYTEEGYVEKIFHLHLRFLGDNDEINFRDYLRDHWEVAQSYEKLKLGLHYRYKHNRDAYTKAKTDVIVEYTKKAKKEYGERYGSVIR